MKKNSIIIFAFFGLLFSSCRKEHAPDCLTPTGDDVTQIRTPGEFFAVDLNSKIDMTIVNGAEQKVEVTGGEYLLDKITTSVNNGTLVIDNDNRCNFVRGYKRKIRVLLTVPFIRGVINNGVGDIVFDAAYKQDTMIYINAGNSGDIHVNGNFGKIETSSHGNGDLYFNGTADQLNVYCNGTNYTYADKLDVKNYIFISTYSLGDVYLKLNSNNNVDYYIQKDGNIYYTGTPAVMNQRSDGTAKGRAIKID